AYRGKTHDLHTIRREYNVHFAIEGSVRRENDRLLVVASMFDTADDRAVWSDHYDLPDTKQSWDYVLRHVQGGHEQASMDTEVVRANLEHPGDLDKRDLMFAQSATALSRASQENYRTRLALANQALALDPDYVWALSTKARVIADNILAGFSTNRDA